LSHGEEPERMVFTWENAVEKQFPYIDAFDKAGNKVESYKLVDGEYTMDF
jgi:hypothetical protein